MTKNDKTFKHIVQSIIKFGLTQARISSNLHTAVIYGPRSLRGIGIFDPIVNQGAGQIAFLIKHFWKPTPSSQLIHTDLSTLQLEAGRGERILEYDYPETQR